MAPLFGPTGLGSVPTAQTVPSGTFELSGAYAWVDADPVNVDLGPKAGVVYGFNRGEIGAGYYREKQDFEGEEFKFDYLTLHGKYRVFESQTADINAVSIGAHYLDYRDFSGSTLSLYAAAQSTLVRNKDGNERWRGHFGARVQRSDFQEQDETKFRPFFGFEYIANPDWRFATDFAPSRAQFDSTMSLAARYQKPGGNLGGQIGIGRLGGDPQLFASLTLRFGN